MPDTEFTKPDASTEQEKQSIKRKKKADVEITKEVATAVTKIEKITEKVKTGEITPSIAATQTSEIIAGMTELSLNPAEIIKLNLAKEEEEKAKKAQEFKESSSSIAIPYEVTKKETDKVEAAKKAAAEAAAKAAAEAAAKAAAEAAAKAAAEAAAKAATAKAAKAEMDKIDEISIKLKKGEITQEAADAEVKEIAKNIKNISGIGSDNLELLKQAEQREQAAKNPQKQKSGEAGPTLAKTIEAIVRNVTANAKLGSSTLGTLHPDPTPKAGLDKVLATKVKKDTQSK